MKAPRDGDGRASTVAARVFGGRRLPNYGIRSWVASLSVFTGGVPCSRCFDARRVVQGRQSHELGASTDLQGVPSRRSLSGPSSADISRLRE